MEAPTMQSAILRFTKEVNGKAITVYLDLNFVSGTLIIRGDHQKKEFVFGGTIESSAYWNVVLQLMSEATIYGRDVLRTNMMS
jgi:hypothetical protein